MDDPRYLTDDAIAGWWRLARRVYQVTKDEAERDEWRRWALEREAASVAAHRTLRAAPRRYSDLWTGKPIKAARRRRLPVP